MIKRYYYAKVKAPASNEDGFFVFYVRSFFANPVKAMNAVIIEYNKEYGKGKWTVTDFKRIK